jgi:hypothetical protein
VERRGYSRAGSIPGKGVLSLTITLSVNTLLWYGRSAYRRPPKSKIPQSISAKSSFLPEICFVQSFSSRCRDFRSRPKRLLGRWLSLALFLVETCRKHLFLWRLELTSLAIHIEVSIIYYGATSCNTRGSRLRSKNIPQCMINSRRAISSHSY